MFDSLSTDIMGKVCSILNVCVSVSVSVSVSESERERFLLRVCTVCVCACFVCKRGGWGDESVL